MITHIFKDDNHKAEFHKLAVEKYCAGEYLDYFELLDIFFDWSLDNNKGEFERMGESVFDIAERIVDDISRNYRAFKYQFNFSDILKPVNNKSKYVRFMLNDKKSYEVSPILIDIIKNECEIFSDNFKLKILKNGILILTFDGAYSDKVLCTLKDYEINT